MRDPADLPSVTSTRTYTPQHDAKVFFSANQIQVQTISSNANITTAVLQSSSGQIQCR